MEVKGHLDGGAKPLTPYLLIKGQVGGAQDNEYLKVLQKGKKNETGERKMNPDFWIKLFDVVLLQGHCFLQGAEKEFENYKAVQFISMREPLIASLYQDA